MSLWTRRVTAQPVFRLALQKAIISVQKCSISETWKSSSKKDLGQTLGNNGLRTRGVSSSPQTSLKVLPKHLSFHWAQTSQQSSLVNKFPSRQIRSKNARKSSSKWSIDDIIKIAFALIRFPALSRVHNRLPPFPNHYFQLIKISFQRHFPNI